MEHERDGDTNCNRCALYSHQRIGTGTGGIGNNRTNGDHPNYSIVEIGQNTGNLRRFAIQWETTSYCLCEKIQKEKNCYNNNIYIYIYIQRERERHRERER